MDGEERGDRRFVEVGLRSSSDSKVMNGWSLCKYRHSGQIISFPIANAILKQIMRFSIYILFVSQVNTCNCLSSIQLNPACQDNATTISWGNLRDAGEVELVSARKDGLRMAQRHDPVQANCTIRIRQISFFLVLLLLLY